MPMTSTSKTSGLEKIETEKKGIEESKMAEA